MFKTWVISDTHFSHQRIIYYENRPFSTTEEMDEEIVRRWNEVVGKDDVVYHLGDVLFGGRKIREDVLPRLNGYKILRLGNHDYRTSKSQWLKYFDEVYDEDIVLDGLCLSHYPLDEVTLQKLIHIGLIKGNVCGHVHSKTEHLDPSKYFCASVENIGYKPIDFEVVKKHFGIES